MDERRRWEELGLDCLTKVFTSVGMESLILAVPFVCKTWYAATLNPLCWQSLYFPDFVPLPLFISDDVQLNQKSFGPFYDKFVHEYRIDKSCFSITGFIKLVVNRSNGKASELKLPGFCTEAALRFVSDACPGLRVLSLRDDLDLFKVSQLIPQVIGKWTFLECLYLGGNMDIIMEQLDARGENDLSTDFEAYVSFPTPYGHTSLCEILLQISINCKHFRGLHIFHTKVGKAEALAIVNLLPNLNYLSLIESRIERARLVTLLQGCKELVHFDVSDSCKGVREGDEEISKLASHIKQFIRVPRGHCFYPFYMLKVDIFLHCYTEYFVRRLVCGGV